MEYIFIVFLFFVFLFFWINGFGNIIERFSIGFPGNYNIKPGGGIELKNMCGNNIIPISPSGTVCFALFNNTSSPTITINASNGTGYKIQIPVNNSAWVDLYDNMFPITIPEFSNTTKILKMTSEMLVLISKFISDKRNQTKITAYPTTEEQKNKGYFQIINLSSIYIYYNIPKEDPISIPIYQVTPPIKIKDISIASPGEGIKFPLRDLSTGNGFIVITDNQDELKSTVIDFYQRNCKNSISPTPPPITPSDTICFKLLNNTLKSIKCKISDSSSTFNLNKQIDKLNISDWIILDNTTTLPLKIQIEDGDEILLKLNDKSRFKYYTVVINDANWKSEIDTDNKPNLERHAVSNTANYILDELVIKPPSTLGTYNLIDLTTSYNYIGPKKIDELKDYTLPDKYKINIGKELYGKKKGNIFIVKNVVQKSKLANFFVVDYDTCKNSISPTPPSPTIKSYHTCSKEYQCEKIDYHINTCKQYSNIHKSPKDCESNCKSPPPPPPPPPTDEKYPACNNPWPPNNCHKGQSCLNFKDTKKNKYTYTCGTVSNKISCSESNQYWCDNASNTPDPNSVANASNAAKKIDIELINYKQEPIYVYIRSQDSFKGNSGVNTNFINNSNATIMDTISGTVYRVKLDAFGNPNDTFNSSMISATKSSTNINKFESVIIWTYPVNGSATVDEYNPVNGPFAGNLIGEFSITDNNIYYDLSAVDGIDKGMTFQYIDFDNNLNPNTKCLLTNKPPSILSDSKFMPKKLYGYSSILSDKWKLGGEEERSCNLHSRCDPDLNNPRQICPDKSECPVYSASQCYIDTATSKRVCCCGGPATKSETNTAVLNIGLNESDINKWINDSNNPKIHQFKSFKYNSNDSDKIISQNVNILRNLGFALPDPETKQSDAKKSLEDIIGGIDWFQGCPGGRTKSTDGRQAHNIFSNNLQGLADNIIGQHNCRVYYYWKYKDPNSYSGWLKNSECMGYTWAMDEFECADENTSSTSSHTSGESPNYLNSASGICGYLYDKSTPDIPSIDDMFNNDWGCSSTSVCSSDYNLPATSCGQTTKTIPLKDETLKRYWENTKGCIEKEVDGQKTNPSPTRNGGKIVITFHDLCWLQDLENEYS